MKAVQSLLKPQALPIVSIRALNLCLYGSVRRLITLSHRFAASICLKTMASPPLLSSIILQYSPSEHKPAFDQIDSKLTRRNRRLFARSSDNQIHRSWNLTRRTKKAKSSMPG